MPPPPPPNALLQVNTFAASFPMPGFDAAAMKYRTFDL